MGTKVEGRCLCGQFSYSFERERAISAHHCHCKDCQRSTGSGKATFVMIPADALETAGDLTTYTVTGTDGTHVTRGFCATCGSGLYSYLEEMPDLRFVKAGPMEDSSWIEVESSYWANSAEQWSPVDSRCHAFEQNPIM